MTSTGVPSVNTILDGFLQQPMKIQGLPNYHTLNALRQQLYCNANSFSSKSGKGNHGYLGMLMLMPKCIASTAPNNIPFVTPVFPGYLPAAIVGTAAIMADHLQVHNED
jgi:hypothetical protein